MNFSKSLQIAKAVAQNLGLSRGRCRYYPTCSAYSREAFIKHGPFIGAWLTTKRLLKCHPWSPGGFDPVPIKRDSA